MNLKPALDLIKEFEGFRAKAYKCPAGVWTIGYGTTLYPDGARVKAGDVCTVDQATEWLSRDIARERIPVIRNNVDVPLNNNEFCALLSFIYNVGNGAFLGSTLRRKLNTGYTRVQVADEFKKWNKAKGKVLAGLVRRREAERELFLRPEVKAKSSIAPLV